VHLVGFTIEIYYDARPYGRQNFSVYILRMEIHFFSKGIRTFHHTLEGVLGTIRTVKNPSSRLTWLSKGTVADARKTIMDHRVP